MTSRLLGGTLLSGWGALGGLSAILLHIYKVVTQMTLGTLTRSLKNGSFTHASIGFMQGVYWGSHCLRKASSVCQSINLKVIPHDHQGKHGLVTLMSLEKIFLECSSWLRETFTGPYTDCVKMWMLREHHLHMCLSGCGQGESAKDVGGLFNCMDATSDICNFCVHGDLENQSDNQSPPQQETETPTLRL